MSKLDRVKEQIAWLKAAFLAAIAVDISLIGWLAQNYEQADTIKLILAASTIVLVTLTTVALQRKAFKLMKELEYL